MPLPSHTFVFLSYRTRLSVEAKEIVKKVEDNTIYINITLVQIHIFASKLSPCPMFSFISPRSASCCFPFCLFSFLHAPAHTQDLSLPFLPPPSRPMFPFEVLNNGRATLPVKLTGKDVSKSHGYSMAESFPLDHKGTGGGTASGHQKCGQPPRGDVDNGASSIQPVTTLAQREGRRLQLTVHAETMSVCICRTGC